VLFGASRIDCLGELTRLRTICLEGFYKSIGLRLAITGMVARAARRPFDPVGEIFQPFVSGPNRVPFTCRRSGDDGGEEAMAKSEREEGVGTGPPLPQSLQ
jgi:hypothetical protein